METVWKSATKGYDDETFYLSQKHFEQREQFNGYDTGYIVQKYFYY